MSEHKNPKNDRIVSGYINESTNAYMPNDVIYVVLLFYGKYNLFDTFNDEGICIKNKSQTINVNDDVLFFRDYNDKISDNGEGCFNSLNVRKKRFDVISQGMSNYHYFVYTHDNKLYGFGSNEYKQVCGSLKTDIEIPTLINSNVIFDSRLTQICCGAFFSLFLTQNGNVYGTGDNEYNQLTNKYASNNKGIQKIISTSNIIRIGCTCETSVILDNNGILRSFGKHLIDVSALHDNIEPRHINIGAIINFSCGYGHIGFITKNNELFMKGLNDNYQCGMENKKYVNIHQVSLNGNITNIKCGGYHTIVTVNKNQFYSFGYNKYHILLQGRNGWDTVHCLPQLISNEYIMEITKSKQKILDIIPTKANTYILQESTQNQKNIMNSQNQKNVMNLVYWM